MKTKYNKWSWKTERKESGRKKKGRFGGPNTTALLQKKEKEAAETTKIAISAPIPTTKKKGGNWTNWKEGALVTNSKGMVELLKKQ